MRYALPLLSVGTVDALNAGLFPLPTHVNIVLPEAWVIIGGETDTWVKRERVSANRWETYRALRLRCHTQTP
jgi:hypothetical protein